MGKTVVEFDEELRGQLAKAIYTKNRGLSISLKLELISLEIMTHLYKITAHFYKIIARIVGNYSL